jgi:regulator of sigma E protease
MTDALDLVFGFASSFFSIAFWFIIILIPLVAIHEFGHLIMSRLMGVKVLEYGIGIPPRAIARRFKGMIWSLNWIPLGGFAKIYGDHDALDEAEDLYKSDRELAKETYAHLRVSEIVQSGDLKYFLEDNNLTYDEGWVKFEKEFFKVEDPKQNPLYHQINTLVLWEFDDVINTKQAFCNVSWWRQTVILLGGITFNLLTAIFLFFVIFAFTSTPVSPAWNDDISKIEEFGTITEKGDEFKVFRISSEGTAKEIGLSSGDVLISFDNKKMTELNSFSEFRTLVENQSDEIVDVVFRDSETGEIVETEATLNKVDDKYRFGIAQGEIGYPIRFRYNNIGQAFVESLNRVWQVFGLTFRTVGDIISIPFTGNTEAVQAVGGPIAVGSVGSSIYSIQGVTGILYIAALVSISLAAFNLLPIPALDGGRFIIVTLNKITGKRNKKIEAVIISMTFIILLGLSLVVAFKDVIDLSSGRLGF